MLRRTVVLAALAGVLAAPAAAQADAFKDVFADYQRDGRITACDHSVHDLRTAKAKIPNDIEQYAPDFPAALGAALEERVRSGCGESEQTAAAAPAPPASSGTPATPSPAASEPGPTATTIDVAPSAVPQPPGTTSPAAVAADGAIVNAAARTAERGTDDAPAALIVLGALVVLVLLALLAWGLARMLAWDPAWLAGARHAVAEAGWRASALWDDFGDWARPGRRAAPRQ